MLDTKLVKRFELCRVLNSADVFLFPHRALEAPESGLPTKLFEYQVCGKPIICCSMGEPTQYIRSTESGVVVPPGDPEALSEAILELYRDRKKGRRLGSNGWKHVSEHVSQEKIGEKMYGVFRGLLEAG